MSHVCWHVAFACMSGVAQLSVCDCMHTNSVLRSLFKAAETGTLEDLLVTSLMMLFCFPCLLLHTQPLLADTAPVIRLVETLSIPCHTCIRSLESTIISPSRPRAERGVVVGADADTDKQKRKLVSATKISTSSALFSQPLSSECTAMTS